MNKNEILQIALRQSAYDCNCEPEDFLKQENVINESVLTDKARRYLKLPHICDMVSYGSNIVACGRKDLLPDIKEYLDGVPNIENCFETPGLYPLNRLLAKAEAEVCFMAEYFLPDIDRIFQFDLRCDYELRILGPKDFADLYVPQWKNALCEDRRHLDVIGVGAYDKGKLIGLAGCSADCDTMWQIGIDVLPEYRRQGIASVLTNRIARETLKQGKVPFYCAAWSNVKSVRNAVNSGFKPGWVEITAKPISFVEDMTGRQMILKIEYGKKRSDTKEDLTWKEIRTDHIIQDEWIDLRRSAYQLPDGKIFEPFYSYSRKDYVVIVASDEEDNYLCVRQFRQGIKEVTTEFPAGGIERTDGKEYGTARTSSTAEDGLKAAKRELFEETGYESDEWKYLLTVPSNATMADNYAHIFMARNCRRSGEQHLDETEFLNVKKYSAAEIEELIKNGNFQQAVHIMAWLLAQRR